MAQWKILRSGIGAGFFLVLSVAVPMAVAQPTRLAPNPNRNLISPEVLAGHRVTFRIHAPKASDVTLTGDWMEGTGASDATLTKDDQGVWSITVGPLVPDFYAYSFTVDGVRTLDPRNPLIEPGIDENDSMFEVPGEEAAFEDNKPGPHGDIRMVWYPSGTLDSLRRMHIYTPPGYDHSNARYPVLYLLHGSGDDDSGWSILGRAGFIVDNLLAQNNAKPMIVVMPNGSMPRPANPPSAPAGAGPGRGSGAQSAQDLFASELMKDIIPYVEKNYRVLASRENRAIAGLSMGGGQTLRAGLRDPIEFAYLGVWSAGVNQQRTPDFEQRNAAFLNNPDKTNQSVKLFWIGVGAKDSGANTSAKNLADLLNRHRIKNEFHESAGAHTWINWRHYLNNYAQLLFR